MPGIVTRWKPIDRKEGRSVAPRLWLLLGFMLVMLVSVELFTRALHNRRKVTLNVEDGIHEALAVRRIGGRTHVLFAGNSLIYEGLSGRVLQRSMGTKVVVCAAGVPGSTYYDWLYGLRSLFKRGAQPDIVVFGISPSQFLRAPAVSALPISKLWRSRELVAYYREQHPGLTAMSDLVFEHYSTFFYMRDTVRIYVRKAIPGYEAMVDVWTQRSPAAGSRVIPTAGTGATMHRRLAALQEQLPSRTRLIVIIVPTNQPEDSALEPDLRAAAKDLGITVIEPVAEQAWPVSNFQADHYHLTSEAAIRFSLLAAADLMRDLKADARAD